MEQIPIEIWHRIFHLACIDDGTTGRSLSLVSKHIRTISEPFQLYSVCLANPNQAARFASYLQTAPKHLRRVVHLEVVHDAVLTFDWDNENSSAASSISRWRNSNFLPGVRIFRHFRRAKARGKRMFSFFNDKRQSNEALHDALVKIFTLTTATLRTLTLDCLDRVTSLPEELIPFESLASMGLTSLTIINYAIFLWQRNQASFGIYVHLLSLKYLDLVGFQIEVTHSYKFYEAITIMAPSLTHLRLPIRMADNLENALGYNEDGDPADRLPLSTERVYVQLSRRPTLPFVVVDLGRVAANMSRYRILAQTDKRIVVLNPADEDLTIGEIALDELRGQ